MKTFKGIAHNIDNSIIGKITYKILSLANDKILISEKAPFIPYGIKALITTKTDIKIKIPYINLQDFSLNEGDIVTISPDGTISVIWESNLSNNAVFITDFCNSKCIMCPQKMPDNPQNYTETSLKMLELASIEGVNSIGITGGEPTLDLKGLVNIVKKCKEKFTNAHMLMLTNGKTFADIDKLEEITKINHPNITFCVPLYADNATEHDYIVGASNSFNQTIKGLYNLAQLGQKIEIRIVVIKQNYKRLKDLTEFIYRNLPFVSHIAIMGMEGSGLAKDNFDTVFIDPINYIIELQEAIQHLVQRDMNVSIYNLPLCLLPKSLWRFSRDSISSWKKSYLDNCNECDVKDKCSGLFATSVKQSEKIHPIKY